ncbi:MAG: J domain-containing protein [Nitrospirota bacterium]
MDRRNNPETTGRPSEDRLQKALEVIIQSYKGIPPEKLYNEAIHCFDALIDISHNTEAIKDFASRNEIDLKYLVDGANFVISKMHFNPENNFYITLGIPQNSSPDEIRERWKRLMLLYHPDRQEGDGEWVSERAKKVNEAYSTLKDESRRNAYNKKLVEQAVHAKPVSRPQMRTGRTFRKSAGIHTINPSWARTRRYLPRILIATYIIAAVAFIGFIYFQNSSSELETELLPQKKEAPQSAFTTVEEIREQTDTTEAKAGNNKDMIPDRTGQKTASLRNIEERKQPAYPESSPPVKITNMPGTAKDSGQPPKSIDSGRNEKVDVLKSISNSLITRPLRSAPVASENKDNPEIKPDEPAQKNIALKPDTVSAPQNTAAENTPKKITQRDSATVPDAVAPPGSAAKTDIITRESVEDFMKRYIRAYERNDLETFMTLFSKSAVENNRMNYAAIRNAYKDTFSEKINYYSVQNMDIRIEDHNAFVSGIYNVNRYLSSENRWVRYTGKIRWKLSKEKDALKIISVDYDH